jgi:GT2 family glycosyltransferase
MKVEPKGKILLAVPTALGLVTSDFAQMNTNIVADLLLNGYQVVHAFIKRAMIDEARNNFIGQAENNDCDWIFFLDDDTFIPPNAVRHMIELDKDIVSPPVACRKGSHWVNVFDKKGENISREEIDFEKPIGGIGMACTLIKREVIRKMRGKYDKPLEFQIARNPEGKGIYLGEDISFCYRARMLGFEVWTINGIPTKHMGDPQYFIYDGS